MDNTIILDIHNVSKRFPGVQALDDVSFEICRGRIHALVGENGAGKSTLIKIISGAERMDSGYFSINGEKASFTKPLEAINAGISVVHQEMRLVPQLSVAENIFIGSPQTYKKVKLVAWKRMYREARELLDSIGAESIDEREITGNLSIAEQQMVEICKALSYNAKIIIMDEPSASLTDRELTMLFAILRELRQRGITVIYISHRLEEIFEIANDVTVLRDGRMIHTGPVEGLTRESLISLMVGRTLDNEYPKEFVPAGKTLLEVRNLNMPGVIRDVSFDLKEGEILGIAGLVGSGRTETARIIFGADHSARLSGDILIRGEKVTIKSVQDAMRHGIALIPEDRQRQGLVLGMDVRGNISMASIDRISRAGFLSRKKENDLSEKSIRALRIVTPSGRHPVKNLSGGNQQKVVIAKWLAANSDILIMDEPTRGIDVGAKAEIYKLMTDFAKEGKGIIIISSEMPEIVGMCDRVLVFRDGMIGGELQRTEVTQERILNYAIK